MLSEDNQDKFECMLQVSAIKLSLLFRGRQNCLFFFGGTEEDTGISVTVTNISKQIF